MNDTSTERSVPPPARYAGTYHLVKPHLIRRDTDGLELKILRRAPDEVTPLKPLYFIVQGPDYVSSVYTFAYGSEFESGGVRYVINPTNEELVEITVKYRREEP